MDYNEYKRIHDQIMEQFTFKREEPLYYLEGGDCLTTLESFLEENSWGEDIETLEIWRTNISIMELGEYYRIGTGQGYTYMMRVR